MASKSINELMSYAIRVGLNLDAKDAVRNLNAFRREVGFAKAATQDITGTVKLFNEVTKDLGLTSEQVAIVEGRLTAAHEKRTAKVKEEAATLAKLAAANRELTAGQLERDARAGSRIALNAALDEVVAINAVRDAERQLAIEREKAERFNANRTRGLAVQADIQAERDAVAASRAEREKRLVTFKKEKEAVEALVIALEKQAAAERRVAADRANANRGLPVQAGELKDREAIAAEVGKRLAVAATRAEREKLLVTFKKEKEAAEATTTALEKQSAQVVAAAEQARRAILQSQAALTGWDNGLRRATVQLKEHRDGLAAWTTGLERQAAAARNAASATGQLERQARAGSRAAFNAALDEVVAINTIRDAERQLAAERERAARFNANRSKGLAVQADIQAERDAVAAAQGKLGDRLDEFKKQKEETKQARLAILQAQEALTGWDNGLRRATATVREHRAGVEAWTAGLERQAAAARTAAAATGQLEREARVGSRAAFSAALDDALNVNTQARERNNQVLASGRQYMQQFETSQQTAIRQLREANAQFRAGAITLEQYNRATDRIRLNNNLLHQSFTQVKTAVTTLLGPLVLVYGAYQAFVGSIKLSSELEQATAKFKVFTGSLREAEQTLAEIRELSRSSPVSFTGGQRAVTTMLQFGVASKDVTNSLRQIAEITGGDTERMNNLALAFGQANAAGRLMGQELLQMVNAGFNPLKIISEQTGRSMKDLKDAMAEGEISFQQVAQAFKDAVGPGGQFNGLLQEMANTTAGQITRATNAVQELGIAFGDLLATGGSGSVIAQFTSSVNDLALAVQTLNELGKGNKDGGEQSLLGTLRQASLTGFGLIGQTIDTVKLAQAGVNKDLFAFIEAYDRTINRIGKDNVRDLAAPMRKVVDETEAIKAALKDLDAVRAKAVADRTEAETIALNATDRRDRGAKNVSQADFEKLRAQAKLDLGKDGANRREIFVEFVNEVGQGFLDDADLIIYRMYTAEIEKANEALKEQTRIRASFQDSVNKGKDELLDNRFGKDRADNVRLIRDQATGTEREKINKAIDSGAGYERIVQLANAEARAQLKTLAALQAKNKAFDDAKKKQESPFQKLVAKEKDDLLDNRFGKDKADNVRLIRDQSVGVTRKVIDRAIANGADYDRIVRLADAETRAQLRTLEALQAKNKALDDAKDRQKEAEKAIKQQAEELKKLKKQADEIRNAGNPFKDFIDKASDAQLLNVKGLLTDKELAAEKDRLAKENTKNVTATAAPVINKGSQEAFAALTGQTVDKLTKQLQEAEKANVLATTAAQVRQMTLDKLDELVDAQPGVVGP